MGDVGDSAHALGYFQEINFLSSKQAAINVLPYDRLTKLENFGHSISSMAYLYRPTHVEQVAELLDAGRRAGFQIGMRGAGRSYGDASLNSGQVVVDMRRMNRVLEWNPETGIITVEPGVTIEQLWRYTLEDGWWSPVMPGTMFPTLGGALGSNIHGKNNWQVGTLGEHVLAFTALLPNGEQVVCTPKDNKELFYAMIGGMGILGVFTSITLQLKKIHSGLLNVRAWAEPDLSRVLAGIDENKENDYIVGWVDSTVGGNKLGRGQVHSANYLSSEEDPMPARTLNSTKQDLPDNILGLIPKSMVWRILQMGMSNLGARGGNLGKYMMSRTLSHNKRYQQSLVAFTFLLDYVPNWERAYGRGGLIQYQSFLPKDNAHDGYREMLQLSQRRRNPATLGVVKRHRPDKFLLSHAVDGFSLAFDFKVSDRNRKQLSALTKDMNKIALDAGGRFYFAKDSTLTSEDVRMYLGEKTVKKFKQLKNKYDPDDVLQTDLYRRCFGE